MTSTSLSPHAARLLAICFLLLVGLAGCSWFGDNSKSSTPCSGITSQYAAEGVTQSACANDVRGQWLEGRCYCHSAEDGTPQ